MPHSAIGCARGYPTPVPARPRRTTAKAAGIAACLLLAGLLLAPAGALAQQGPALVADREAETVYSWSRQRCDDNWIPDSAARAYRRQDGSVVLIAAHYTNGALEGRDFDNLSPNCVVATRGSENADPAAFDDRFWVQAMIPGADGKVLAVVSHEYMGGRHAGRCARGLSRRPQCWYSSLLLSEADERDLRFHLLPEDRRIVAAPPRPFDPETERRTGFFTTSNVVRSGDWYYLLSWAEFGNLQGNCLLRVRADDASGQWAALRGGEFATRFPNPYRSGGAADRQCDIVGRGSLRNVLRSVVRVEPLNKWVGVFIMPRGHRMPEGVYYSTSSDLITWDAPRLLFGTQSQEDGQGCRVVYQYPSLIDQRSGSNIFDTAGGEFHLYLTRFNQASCQRGLDRDLVRVRVRVAS